MEPRETDVRVYVLGLFNSWVKPLIGAVAAGIASWWNSAPQSLRAALGGALSLSLADLVLGVLHAVCAGRFRLRRIGQTFKKVATYGAVMLGFYGLDRGLGLNGAAELAIAIMICLREASSVLEHCDALGVPVVPKWLRSRIVQWQQQCDAGPVGNMEVTDGDGKPDSRS